MRKRFRPFFPWLLFIAGIAILLWDAPTAILLWDMTYVGALRALQAYPFRVSAELAILLWEVTRPVGKLLLLGVPGFYAIRFFVRIIRYIHNKTKP